MHPSTNPPGPQNISPGLFDSRGCLKFGVGDIYLRSCISRDICQRGLDVIKSNRFCYFIQKRFQIDSKFVCVIVSTFSCLLISCYSWMCFLSCTIQLMPKNNHQGGLPLSIVKIMKNRYYRFDQAIQFVDFHRFPLSIDKNHLIATDFFLLITPGNEHIPRVTQMTVNCT